MRALPIIQLCAREYQDIGFSRVLKSADSTNTANWLDWLNDAQRTIVLVRPDANAVTRNLTLVLGTRQTLPAGAFRLLAATRNMGADGLTVGKALRMAVHEEQDAVNLDWHTETAASPVREIIYDDKKDPLSYWVRPPGIAGWKIEAVVSQAPTDITDADAGDITISEVYSSALQQWMMHRAYAMATQAAGNMQKSVGHFQEFFNLLGVKLRGELFTGPFTRGSMTAQQA